MSLFSAASPSALRAASWIGRPAAANRCATARPMSDRPPRIRTGALLIVSTFLIGQRRTLAFGCFLPASIGKLEPSDQPDAMSRASCDCLSPGRIDLYAQSLSDRAFVEGQGLWGLPESPAPACTLPSERKIDFLAPQSA